VTNRTGTELNVETHRIKNGLGRALLGVALFGWAACGGGTDHGGENDDPDADGVCVGVECDAVMLRDIAPGAPDPSPSSSPAQLTVVGATTYFTAIDELNGLELWRTDGTAEGTVLLKDLNMGDSWSSVVEMEAVGETVFISLDDPAHGVELWKTDGTPEGTVLVRDIFPGWEHSHPQSLTAVGTKLFFSAIEPVSEERRLYVSDGTAGGTFALPVAEPSLLTAMGGKLYCRGEATAGPEVAFKLWVSDGTADGTMNVQFTPSTDRARPTTMYAHQARLYFMVQHGSSTSWTTHADLYVTGGNSNGSDTERLTTNIFISYSPTVFAVEWASVGTTLVFTGWIKTSVYGDLGSYLFKLPQGGAITRAVLPNGDPVDVRPRDLVVQGDTVFFTALATAANDTRHVMSYDLSTVRDLKSFPATEPPKFLRARGGRVSFVAKSGTTTYGELWETDGTVAGNQLVKTIGDDGADITEMVAMGSSVLFPADNGVNGSELWISDGTSDGTRLLADVHVIPESSNPAWFVELDGRLIFAASELPSVEGGNRELWVSDGTSGGTQRLVDIWEGTDASRPSHLTRVGDLVYFAANDGTGVEPWVTDGTVEGTRMLHDIHVGGSSNPRDFVGVGGTVFFVALDPQHGEELWKTDGTEAGTKRVKDIAPEGASSSPQQLFVHANRLFFSATDGAGGREPWVSDGTEAGTVRLADVNPEAANSQPKFLAVYEGDVYFAATRSLDGRELWKTDGTPGGTALVRDINPNGSDSNPEQPLVWNGRLFFTATTDNEGTELWSTDGTAVGTKLVRDIFVGDSSSPAKLTVSGDALFFAARDEKGTELWKTDGTSAGTVRVRDIHDGAASSWPVDLVDMDGLLLFIADDGLHGEELWASDGTEAGTRLVADVWEGPWSGAVHILGRPALSAAVLFEASDGIDGVELWRTDGTTDGTRLVQDFAAGTGSSEISEVFGAIGRIFFNVNDGVHGHELWAMPISGI
jgi:trimeric autotransporter adhesin